MSEEERERELQDARAKALEFLAERDEARSCLHAAHVLVRKQESEIETLKKAAKRDHAAEIGEALGVEGAHWTWPELLGRVRRNADKPLERTLRELTGLDSTYPLHQLLDHLRWCSTVVTPERNELQRRQMELLHILNATNVDTIAETAERLVRDFDHACAELEKQRDAAKRILEAAEAALGELALQRAPSPEQIERLRDAVVAKGAVVS